MTHAFYIPGKHWAEDGAVLVDGIWRGEWSRHKTLADFPDGAVVLPDDEVRARIEAACKTPPVEVGVDRFTYLLEVLPPLNWCGVGTGVETFKLSEFTNGRVTTIAAKIGARYFEFQDVCTMGHAEIVAKVQADLRLS